MRELLMVTHNRVNKIFDPANSNLTVTIDINKPTIRLEITTAINTAIVLKSNPKTSHD